MPEETPAYLAQFDPMPGDTMSDPWGGVYTVTSVVGDTVFCDYHLGAGDTVPSPAYWTLVMWSEDTDGFSWARPALTGPQAP